jgi:hypothetical protein
VRSLKSRAELADLRRQGRRRQLAIMLVAIGPAVVYLLPAFLPKGTWSWGTSSLADTLICGILIFWMFYFFFRADRSWKDVGLSCASCGHVLVGASYEVVMATGRCGGCGAQVLVVAPPETPNTSCMDSSGK